MGTPFKMKGSPMQRNFGIGSPLKGKGDNLKRIMTEKKVEAKKLGTWYKSGAEPKVNKGTYPKDFNIKGDSWKTKTPGYKDTKAAKIKEALKTHHKHTTGPEAMKTPEKAKVSKIKQLKKATKKYIPKILKQIGKRLGPIGAAVTVAETITTIPEVTKATIKGLKEKAKSSNINIGRKL